MAKEKLPKRSTPRNLQKKPPTAEELFQPPEFAKKYKPNPDVVMQPPYHCHCTYKEFPEQKGNFYQIGADMFAANNGYFPVSKTALESYFKHIAEESGNDRLALHRIAQYLDLYVNDTILDAVLDAPDGKNYVGRLVRQATLKQYLGKTYLDTMLEGGFQQEESEPEVEQEAEGNIDPRAVDLFGSGFTPQEYELMLQHYDKLLKQFENADGLQEAIILNLCQIHTAGQIAYTNKDMEGFEKMQRLYNQTLKDERLKAKKTDNYGDDEAATWGTLLATIEQYAPGEAYQQPDLYKDVNGFETYMRNTYVRSVANYFGKADEKDPDFSLTDEEMLGDG